MFTPDFSPGTTDDVLVLTIESSEGVDGGDRVVTEITIFAEKKDDKRSIMLLDMADILSDWFDYRLPTRKTARLALPAQGGPKEYVDVGGRGFTALPNTTQLTSRCRQKLGRRSGI